MLLFEKQTGERSNDIQKWIFVAVMCLGLMATSARGGSQNSLAVPALKTGQTNSDATDDWFLNTGINNTNGVNMIEEIKKVLESYAGEWKEKKNVWEFSATIAERKAFLSKKKLTYSAKMRIDDDTKVLKFSEMLIESGSGLSSGGGFDDGMTTGFGFKTESYNTMSGAREGNIEEKSNLFGKKFEYKFDYKEVRSKIEETAKSAGFKFEYQILPVK